MCSPCICDDNIGTINLINPHLAIAIIKPKKNLVHNLIMQFDHVQGKKKQAELQIDLY